MDQIELTCRQRREMELEGLRRILLSDPHMTVRRASRIMAVSQAHGVDLGLEILAHGANWRVSSERLILLGDPAGTEADAMAVPLAIPQIREEEFAPLTYIRSSNAADRWKDRSQRDAATLFVVLAGIVATSAAIAALAIQLVPMVASWLH